MIGSPPAQDEQARLSGARGDFVASLPRRLEVLRAALRAVEDQPRDPDRINGFLRRLHALGSAARVLGFASVAEALGEAEKTLRRVARSGPAPSDLADIGRALDLLPSLVLGAKVSTRAVVPPESLAAPPPDFPLSVLVFGLPATVELLQQQTDLRIDCEHTEDPAKARELSRVFGPDITIIDADRKGGRELLEQFLRDPLLEPVPMVVIGEFANAEIASTFLGLGATRVLPKPLSPELLRRTLIELRDQSSPAVFSREPLGELNVSQLVDRVTTELRRGLVEAVDPSARVSSVGFGDGTDVLSAVWGTVARLRELVTLRSDGNVRFEPTGPEGAVPLAPWNDERRLGQRGGREGRFGQGVPLQGRRVVVADDDPAVVWFLSGILKAVGAEVFEAHDGERAFELTASLWPDLVVSDVLMPKLDGFSLCHEIKLDVAVRDVPVILLSWKEDLLQRVRELGGDADGYLRKEAAASTVVERLREVLRPRARVEARVAAGGEVRGRLDGLTPRLVLELACRARRDVRVSVRDSSYLYEIQVRAGAPRTAIRSASDGSFERGEGVLAMLLGVSAGRFVIEPDTSPCRPELSGSLHEQLAAPVARARAAQRALSAGALASVTRVAFDAARIGGYLDCTPQPAQSLLRELITGASPRDLLTSGRAPSRLLEAVLSDFARRGAVLMVETAGGIEDISQTRVPPSAAPALGAIPTDPEAGPAPLRESAPPAVAAPAPDAAPAEAGPSRLEVPPAAEETEPPPVSQRNAPLVYSQPPDAELASADAGWFSFQIEASAPPPEAAPGLATESTDQTRAVSEQPKAERPLARSDDPLRKTLTSSAPPAAAYEAQPGASVPVQRGHRPELRSDTLGSAGNEAAAAQAAVAAEQPAVSLVEPRAIEAGRVVAPPRSASPVAPDVEDDPLAQALLDTPAPAPGRPLSQTLPLAKSEPPPASPAVSSASAAAESLRQTLPLSSAPKPPDSGERAATSSQPRPSGQSSDASTAPPMAAPRPASSKAPARTTKVKPVTPPQPPSDSQDGGWLRTAFFSLLAAGGTFVLVRTVTGMLAGHPDPAPSSVEPAPSVLPAVVPVPVAPAAPATPQLSVSEAPLAPGSDVPAGSGLLEIQVSASTPMRVDGEFLGTAQSRRIPLTPGPHQVALGDSAAQTVVIKAGQRTLARLEGGAPATPSAAPAGSP